MGDNYLKKTLNIPVCLVCSSEVIIQRIPKASRILRQNLFEFRFKLKTALNLGLFINAYKSVWMNFAGNTYFSCYGLSMVIQITIGSSFNHPALILV